MRSQRKGAQAAAVSEDIAPAAVSHGGVREKAGKGQGANSTLPSKGSTHIRTIVGRLKRDRPDIVARMARGEFASVQAAASPGEIGNGRSRPDNVRSTPAQYGTHVAYIVGRLERDRPDRRVSSAPTLLRAE